MIIRDQSIIVMWEEHDSDHLHKANCNRTMRPIYLTMDGINVLNKQNAFAKVKFSC